MTNQARPLTDHLRDGKNWLNGGNCCGQKDSSGTCAAPACVFGEALKWFFEAADEIDRLGQLRHTMEKEYQNEIDRRDEIIACNSGLAKLLLEYEHSTLARLGLRISKLISKAMTHISLHGGRG